MINRILPEEGATLAGYAALIQLYALKVPSPYMLAAISLKHKKYETDEWRVLTPRHAPENTLSGHLIFALKYEGLDLGVLKALFAEIDPTEIIAIVNAEPNGSYARRIWFLYEYLQDKTLDIPDATQGNFIDLLDSKLQYTGPSRPSKRHHVRNNLPGVKDFCPLIQRTKCLDDLIAQDLSAQAIANMGSVHPDVLMRAAAFLLLEDSKASYAIEGEAPPHNRATRWGSILGKAGQIPLSKAEFERLQREVITDTRFTHMGYREEGGFIGTHDRATNMPIPDHISARFEDLERLMNGLFETAKLLRNSDFPPVLAATLIAFGFVFIHPFEDGNGRLHRYLFHHILSETGFTPKALVFPVSSVILERISEYRQVLEHYSKPRLPYIDWRPTDKSNVEVLNDTFDLYRFFDATRQAEFFYTCVFDTVTKALPQEVAYLAKYDEMKQFITHYIEMPNRLSDLLIRFLQQNEGKLSERAKAKEYNALTPQEIETIENKFADIFEP